MVLSKRKKHAQRALTPLTRESTRETGEIVREFDVRSAAMVLGAAIGVIFLLFFLAAFLPWLLANGMTAAVEGMMRQVGFNDFEADTLGDWILVLFIGAVFTAFIVAVAVGILALYNILSQRTGMGLRVIAELPPGEETQVLEASSTKAAAKVTAPKATKATATKTATKKAAAKKSTVASKSDDSTAVTDGSDDDTEA